MVTRGALSAALSGRDAESLLPVIEHIAKYITDPRHTQVMCAMCHRLLDSYSLPGDGRAVAGSAESLLAMMNVLQERANAELKVQDELVSIKGMLDSLLATAAP